MADSEGRVGSVVRAVTAFQMNGPGIAMGDLLLGGYSGGTKALLEPVIEPAVTGAIARADGSLFVFARGELRRDKRPERP